MRCRPPVCSGQWPRHHDLVSTIKSVGKIPQLLLRDRGTPLRHRRMQRAAPGFRDGTIQAESSPHWEQNATYMTTDISVAHLTIGLYNSFPQLASRENRKFGNSPKLKKIMGKIVYSARNDR